MARVFKITAIDEGQWEEVIDFTKIQKGGVLIQDILSRLTTCQTPSV